jgi:hypothetical protein
MDSVSQITMMANTEVLKEPRGFIKFIQIIIAIFAFATATSYHGTTSYSVSCAIPNGTEKPEQQSLVFGYPFRLEEANITVNVCGTRRQMSMYGDFSAPSQFYVFVGVTAFLYCLGMLIFYVFGDDKYRNIETIPIVDFIVTAIYGLLWLISSSAFADAVTKIKHYTNPEDYFEEGYACECVNTAGCPHGSCNPTNTGNYASINVSVIFGFLCMVVWVGNLWFLYKETKWHKSANMPPPMPQQSTPSGDLDKQQI